MTRPDATTCAAPPLGEQEMVMLGPEPAGIGTGQSRPGSVERRRTRELSNATVESAVDSRFTRRSWTTRARVTAISNELIAETAIPPRSITTSATTTTEPRSQSLSRTLSRPGTITTDSVRTRCTTERRPSMSRSGPSSFRWSRSSSRQAPMSLRWCTMSRETDIRFAAFG